MGNGIENKAIHQIVEASKNDSLIVFVGAGISVESGLPSWSNLIEKMKKELSINSEVDDNLKIAQFYYDTWGQQRYFQKIMSIFNEYEPAQPNEIHNQILNIHPRHLITTNYDTLLEDKMNSAMIKYDVIKSDDDIPYSDSKHYLIKMHGDFSKKNIVLKEDDYLDYESNFYMVSTLIKSLIMNNTLLFIGYSLGDSTFNSIFRIIQNGFDGNAKKAYFYTPNRPEQTVIEYYKKKGIYVLADRKKVDYKNFGKSTENFMKKISSKLKYKARNQKQLWNNIKFLNQLSFVDSVDVVNYADLAGKAWLRNPDNYNWASFENDKKNFFEISKKSKVEKFIAEKTGINKFLNIEMDTHYLTVNGILEPGFKLYKNKEYGKAKKKFREIANSAYINGNYMEFLIAEFNVLHISTGFYEKNPELSTPVYGKEDFDSVVNNIIEYSNENQSKMATFLKENIFNFKFVLRKMNKIVDLLNKLMAEHNTYKNGGWSQNDILPVLRYEFQTFMWFIEYNCICVDQYSEFRMLVDKYFEGLLLAFDNSTIKNDESLLFKGTSSIIKQLELEDIQSLMPYINYKMLPVYMDTYSLSEIKVSGEAYDFIVKKIEDYCEENKDNVNNMLSYNLLNHYVQLLKITHVHRIKDIIKILDIYPIFANGISGKTRKSILQIIYKNKEYLTTEDCENLLQILKKQLNLVISNDYESHFDSFELYNLFLSFLKEKKLNTEISINKFSDELILINERERISSIEHYEKFIVSFYEFLTDQDRSFIDNILNKYGKLPKNEIKNVFVISMVENRINLFESLKSSLLSKLIEKIKAPKDSRVTKYPDPAISAIIDLYQLQQQGYFSLEQIHNADADSLIMGKFPEIDWYWFGKRDDETIKSLLKNRTFANIKKYFCNNDEDKKILNEWLIRNMDSENIKIVSNTLINREN